MFQDVYNKTKHFQRYKYPSHSIGVNLTYIYLLYLSINNIYPHFMATTMKKKHMFEEHVFDYAQ